MPQDSMLANPFSSLAQGMEAADAASKAGDQHGALAILDQLRGQFSDQPQPLHRIAGALVRLRRFEQADAILLEGSMRFPADGGFLVELAQSARERGDHATAVGRWATVRARQPGSHVGWTSGALALRELGLPGEADALLRDAIARFPDLPEPVVEAAWLVHLRRDWPRAVESWSAVRARFPNLVVGYASGAAALREAGHTADAEALLSEATTRFPNESAPWIEHAWMAHHRHDWTLAAQRWALVRERFPNHLAGYVHGAQALRAGGETALAETVLGEAVVRFPHDATAAIEHATLATHRRDWNVAAQRWQAVRERFPEHPASYSGAALALREQKRFDEADAVLTEATARFPQDANLAAEHSWVAHVAHDWPEATRRWTALRERFPHLAVGWTSGAIALREQRQHTEAEALLLDAITRFPQERTPLLEHAWLASAQRNWPEALRRWELVRARYPDLPEAWQRTALAHAELWQFDAAEAMLREAIARFPDDPRLAEDFAHLALRENRPDAAAERFDALRARFPMQIAGHLGSAIVLRNKFRIAEAAELLVNAQKLLPDAPTLALEHATLPIFAPMRRDRDPDETIRRLAVVRERFPTFEPGQLAMVRQLRDAGRFDEADRVAEDAIQKLPNSAALAVEFGNNAQQRGDAEAAIRRFTVARDRFPNEPGGPIGLASLLAQSGQDAAADTILEDVLKRFPQAAAAYTAYAEIAMRREDWPTALTRWKAAEQRFPDDKSFTQRIFDVQLHLTADGASEAVAERSSATDDPRAQMRDLVMQFESLGGRGIGCEFGMFQREFAAEPLGLLRWADMPYDGIIQVLESRFEGVGLPDNTLVFINRENGRPEYCTRDLRGFMFMRAFVYEDEMPMERMRKQALRRIGYLKGKLIDDLSAGGKIFVWRLTERNLTDAELDRLHAAVRSYGENTLLYVRTEDDLHPNGTVEVVRPGLMVAYIDRFKMAPDGTLASAPASASWSTICRRAYAIWQTGAVQILPAAEE